MTTEEMIRKIVKQTIAELRASDMIRTSGKTEEEKTEELLRHYSYFLASKKTELIKVVGEIPRSFPPRFFRRSGSCPGPLIRRWSVLRFS